MVALLVSYLVGLGLPGRYLYSLTQDIKEIWCKLVSINIESLILVNNGCVVTEVILM